jgi:HSP20 family protein
MRNTSLTTTPPRTGLLSTPLERFLGTDVFRPFFLPFGEEISERGWMPAVDIRETDDAYVFHAELPGMKKADINITVENNILTLSGERVFAGDSEKNDFRRIERAYGSFTRSFTLPNKVKAEKVEAAFNDGVLSITVPKMEEAKPRRVEIH